MSEEQDFTGMATMWRDQPDMARTMFAAGIDYPMQEGDTVFSVAERFGMPWQRLVEGALKQWNQDGSALPAGFESFGPGQTIRIPAPQEAWQNTFSALDEEQKLSMWSNQPQAAAMLFPNGMPHTIDDGDSLKTLAEKFSLPWEAIAEATMGSSDPKAINDWLANNGGKKLPSGYWAFQGGQVITIPAPVDQPEPDLEGLLAAVVGVSGDDLALA